MSCLFAVSLDPCYLTRIRYDRLMAFGWKVLYQVSLILAFITTGILLAKN
ncbi:hypothetical protein [Candidatus Villigracilis affinis]